jgi:UDP-apiose/xylose synthase
MDYIPGIDGEGIPRVIACFMDALMHNKPMYLVDGGANKRCYTWIGDVIEAVVAILKNPAQSQYQIFNIGNPKNELSVQQLAQKMAFHFAQITHKSSTWQPKIQSISGEQFYGRGYEDSDRRLPDISHATQQLQWVPQTNIDTALHHTITWFLQEYGPAPINDHGNNYTSTSINTSTKNKQNYSNSQ